MTRQGSFWAAYGAAAGAYDEVFAGPGELRSHWEYVAQAWHAMPAMERTRRRAEIDRLLRETGVTYTVYGEGGSTARLWPLDPIPMLIPSREWQHIEHGLIQRAELLNAILCDLYGPRRLISLGVVPPEVVFGHTGFLRAAAGTGAAGGQLLQIYAADLLRGPDGSVRVLGDRAQAPSGMGYALQNRLVVSRVLPSLYRDACVHRLAIFFRALRERLAGLANTADTPRIVVLTPGPGNETYFEQSYLASYLGFELVQGRDLAVRDGRVWIETLRGALPVHVILRRVDDEYCDPVELRAGSLLGTPGLLAAVRSGAVVVANPIGSGVLENPGLMPFLSAACQHLLGEALRLESVPTWWCGSDSERAHVLANLDRLILKPIARTPGASMAFGGELSRAQREEWAARIRAQPYRYVAQERLAVSQTPVLVGHRPEPRATILRTFAVAQESAYLVMPGGLTRVAPAQGSWVVTNQRGGISKDTWVLASELIREDTLLPPRARSPSAAPEEIESLSSRVAEHLFWFGRYAERADCTARLLRDLLWRPVLQPLGTTGCGSEMEACLRVLTHVTATYPGFAGPAAQGAPAAPEGELVGLLRDSGRMGTLAHALLALLRAGRDLRDWLPADASRVLSALAASLDALAALPPERPGEALPTLDDLVAQLAAVAALTAERMGQGPAWLFLDLGRRIERALQVMALLRAVLVLEPAAPVTLQLAVAVADEAAGRYDHTRDSRDEKGLLARLLLDEAAPRAVGYQLQQIRSHIAAASGAVRGAAMNEDERIALELLDTLQLTGRSVLASADGVPGVDSPLDRLLCDLERLLRDLSDAVASRYLGASAPLVRQFASVG